MVKQLADTPKATELILNKQAWVRNISVCGNGTVTHLNSSAVKLPFCGSDLEACSSKGETMFRRCYRSYVTKYSLDLLHCSCTGWNYKFNKNFFCPFSFFERVSLLQRGLEMAMVPRMTLSLRFSCFCLRRWEKGMHHTCFPWFWRQHRAACVLALFQLSDVLSSLAYSF